MNYMIIILLGLTIIPIFFSIIFIPYWTRKTESFGVSIPELVYNDAKLVQMRKQYAVVIGIMSTLFIGAFVFIGLLFRVDENIISIVFSGMIILFLISSFFVYLHYHHKMKDLKQFEKWAEGKTQQIIIDTKFRNRRLTYSNRWFIISFLISIITIVVTLQFYERIPNTIPLQYDLLGKVTNSAEKSYRSVLIIPITQMFMTSLFLFINIVIARAKQQISVENPEESIRRNIIFRRRWSLFIIIMGTALGLMFSLIQLSFIFPINHLVLFITPLVITLGSLIGAIVLSITTGQGGSRLGKVKDSSGNIIDRDDDQYWKLGQFYFNKGDPSLFIEKRFGVGWTNNWARPLSWIILLGIILLAAGIPFLLTM